MAIERALPTLEYISKLNPVIIAHNIIKGGPLNMPIDPTRVHALLPTSGLTYALHIINIICTISAWRIIHIICDELFQQMY